jgi:AcrR family transcriptional regulator
MSRPDERPPGSARARADEPTEPIWARPEPPGRGGLSRAEIVRAALQVADAEGLEAVSMRRLARELRSGAMSLYHYFESRDELLELMAETVAADMLVPELPGDWRPALTAIAQRTRATFLAHPWMLATLNERPRVTPNLLRHVEQTAQALRKLGEDGVDPALLTGLALAADDYTIGYTIRELAGVEREVRLEDSAREPHIRYLLESGEFPMLEEFTRRGGPLPGGDRFAQGLDWLLDGFAAELGAR